MGFHAIRASPQQDTPPSKNRVGVFRRSSPLRARSSSPQPVGNVRFTRQPPAIFASGRPCWPSRDPIGEAGGVNMYGFVGNEGVGKNDPWGLTNEIPGYPKHDPFWGHARLYNKPCCAGREYDPSQQCCCDGKVLSRERKKTGIRRCCWYSGEIIWHAMWGTPDVHRPDHCWVEYPGGARGFYPPPHLIGPGDVFPEIYYPNLPDGFRFSVFGWKECEELNASECDYDVPAISQCLASRTASLIYIEFIRK